MRVLAFAIPVLINAGELKNPPSEEGLALVHNCYKDNCLSLFEEGNCRDCAEECDEYEGYHEAMDSHQSFTPVLCASPAHQSFASVLQIKVNTISQSKIYKGSKDSSMAQAIGP